MINTTYVRFHRLPDNLKAAVTSPDAIEQIEKLEQQYGVALADLLIKIMVKEVVFADFPKELQKESELTDAQAGALLRDLQATILRPVMPYLAAPQQPRAVPVAQPPQQMQSRSQMQSRPIAHAPLQQPASSLPTTAFVRPAPPSRPAPQPLPRPVRPLPLSASPPPPVSPAASAAPSITVPRPVPPPPPLRRPGTAQSGQNGVQQASSRAAFYINPEDEADIARHRDKLRGLAGDSPTALLDDVVSRLFDRVKLQLPSEKISRARTMVLSRLRDVRGSDELAMVLTRPWESGGIGLEPAVANALLRMVDDEAAKLHDREIARHLAAPKPMGESPLPEPTPAPPVAPTQGIPPQSQAVPIQQPPIVKLFPSTPPSGQTPTVPAPAQGVAPSVSRPVPPATVVRPFIERARTIETNQRLIHDIKRPTKPVSPAEELATLTVDDFRQMARTFAEAAGKVLERVHLLAEESYTKRAEGMMAWHRSDLYKLYLTIGRESMAQARTIEEIITVRKDTGQPYLTSEEFLIIADLNRQLTV